MKTPVINLLTFLYFLLAACNTETIRENDETDISDARVIVDKYYNYLKKHDFPNALTNFDDNIIANDSIGMLKHLEETLNNKGPIINYEYLDGRSKVIITNDVKEGGYTLLYKVQYLKEIRNERFELKTNSKQNIKIIECVFEIK